MTHQRNVINEIGIEEANDILTYHPKDVTLR